MNDPARNPAFSRLFQRARQRLEREPDALPRARTQLRDPTPQERRAVEGLLGRRIRGETLTVSLADLDAALRQGTGAGLMATLERLGGPLRHRPAEQAARATAVAAALTRIGASPLAAEPWFEAWVDGLQGAPVTRLVSEGALRRLDRAVSVLEKLPADDVPIALFASRHAGGTKALDHTPLEALVLRALAHRADVPRPDAAVARRALWERFGVVPDDLTTTVLVLNLPATGGGLVDQMLRLALDEGVPLRLTLHQIVHHTPALRACEVFVCENPAVLRMAAERHGPDSRPLIATEGRANTAFWRLLALCPGPIRARGDFDKEGLEIAAAVLARASATPWRFDCATYLQARTQQRDPSAGATPRAGDAGHASSTLPDRLPPTPWDPDLCSVMSGGRRVEEEELIDVLLGDLQG